MQKFRNWNSEQEMKQKYDVLAVGAHPDDIEVAMGGTVARLQQQDHPVLIVDLTDGEPARHAEPGVRARQAAEAARILQVDRITLNLQDRYLVDDIATRLKLAALIRRYRPAWVFTAIGCQIHPDHQAVTGIVESAVFYARLPKWETLPGG
ncbi:MAG: LmbE family protein, partial [Calditrichaeota bacterium]